MAKSCVAIGIKSLCGDCCRYIKIGCEALQQRAKLLQECCQGKMSDRLHYQFVFLIIDYYSSGIVAQERQYQSTLKTQKHLTQQLKDLEGTLTFADSNTIFKELKESYKEDKEVGDWCKMI